MTTLREAVQEFVADSVADNDCGGCGHFTYYAERFRAALAQDSWQPIATAPQTGRKVILFYLNRNSLPRTVMARWITDEQAAETDGDGVGLEAGWYECIDNWDDYTEVAIHEGEPTHWMPLPAAPRKEEA
jgi:hypothetical protein